MPHFGDSVLLDEQVPLSNIGVRFLVLKGRSSTSREVLELLYASARHVKAFRHWRIGSSPLSGRRSHDLAEASVEGRLISESCVQRNLEQRLIGVEQQRLRSLNSPVQQVATNRNSKGPFEGAHKTAWR